MLTQGLAPPARRLGFILALCFTAAAARGQDRCAVSGLLDVRAVHVDGTASYLYGGLGRFRFDSNHQGVRLGRAVADLRCRIDDLVTLSAVVGSYGDGDKHPIDLTELWLELRPYPTGPVRYKFRAGAFHMPASLENRDIAWNTPYSLTSSAINTWLGEEFRTIGVEGEARWLGAHSGYYGEMSAVAGVYGWNDPAGELIATRGWALHDRQSTLFGGLGRPRIAFYREIDRHPGYYGGFAWRHHERLELQILRYDNRADPGAHNSDDYAWRTQFTSLGLRWEPDLHWTFVAQSLQGQTYVGADTRPDDQFAMSFRSWFALGSWSASRERISARYDHFSTRQRSGFYGLPSNDNGRAWMLAYLHDFDSHWQLAGEWQQVRSTFPPRVNIGAAEQLTETQLQLAVRYRFALRR